MFVGQSSFILEGRKVALAERRRHNDWLMWSYDLMFANYYDSKFAWRLTLSLDLFSCYLRGRPQALIQRMHFWSPCFGLVKGTNRTPSHNSRYLLSELQVLHAQCFTCIFSSFTSILPSFPRRFQCTPQQKRAYSALHPQALTECSPLDFRRSFTSC